MRTVLVGAVESTRVALMAMASQGRCPTALFTLPPERSRRHSDYVNLRPIADRLGVTVMEATDVNHADVLNALRRLEPDYVLVIGWSQICRGEFLRVPQAGAIGYHPALLPENRGRAVIPWTILQRAQVTGSTLFWLDEGIDSGDILAQERIDVASDETAGSLYAKHMTALSRMLQTVLPQLADRTAARIPQDHERATYCARRTAADGCIDWSRGADDVWTLIRASSDPYPGAFTFRWRQRLWIWAADRIRDRRLSGAPGQVHAIDEFGALVQCGDGDSVRVRVVQLEGAERVDARELLRPHEKLGADLSGLHPASIAEADT